MHVVQISPFGLTLSSCSAKHGNNVIYYVSVLALLSVCKPFIFSQKPQSPLKHVEIIS